MQKKLKIDEEFKALEKRGERLLLRLQSYMISKRLAFFTPCEKEKEGRVSQILGIVNSFARRFCETECEYSNLSENKAFLALQAPRRFFETQLKSCPIIRQHALVTWKEKYDGKDPFERMILHCAQSREKNIKIVKGIPLERHPPVDTTAERKFIKNTRRKSVRIDSCAKDRKHRHSLNRKHLQHSQSCITNLDEENSQSCITNLDEENSQSFITNLDEENSQSCITNLDEENVHLMSVATHEAALVALLASQHCRALAVATAALVEALNEVLATYPSELGGNATFPSNENSNEISSDASYPNNENSNEISGNTGNIHGMKYASISNSYSERSKLESCKSHVVDGDRKARWNRGQYFNRTLESTRLSILKKKLKNVKYTKRTVNKQKTKYKQGSRNLKVTEQKNMKSNVNEFMYSKSSAKSEKCQEIEERQKRFNTLGRLETQQKNHEQAITKILEMHAAAMVDALTEKSNELDMANARYAVEIERMKSKYEAEKMEISRRHKVEMDKQKALLSEIIQAKAKDSTIRNSIIIEQNPLTEKTVHNISENENPPLKHTLNVCDKVESLKYRDNNENSLRTNSSITKAKTKSRNSKLFSSQFDHLRISSDDDLNLLNTLEAPLTLAKLNIVRNAMHHIFVDRVKMLETWKSARFYFKSRDVDIGSLKLQNIRDYIAKKFPILRGTGKKKYISSSNETKVKKVSVKPIFGAYKEMQLRGSGDVSLSTTHSLRKFLFTLLQLWEKYLKMPRFEMTRKDTTPIKTQKSTTIKSSKIDTHSSIHSNSKEENCMGNENVSRNEFQSKGNKSKTNSSNPYQISYTTPPTNNSPSKSHDHFLEQMKLFNKCLMADCAFAAARSKHQQILSYKDKSKP